MYSVICDGPRRFMSSVCLDCASAATSAADTRISKRGSLVLIGNSCENRPGSARILLPPDNGAHPRTPEWTSGGQVCAPILPLLSFLFLLSWSVSLFLFPRVRPSSLPVRCP